MAMLQLDGVYVHAYEDFNKFVHFDELEGVEIGADVATWRCGPADDDKSEFLEGYRGQPVMVRDEEGNKLFGDLDAVEVSGDTVTVTISVRDDISEAV